MIITKSANFKQPSIKDLIKMKPVNSSILASVGIVPIIDQPDNMIDSDKKYDQKDKMNLIEFSRLYRLGCN